MVWTIVWQICEIWAWFPPTGLVLTRGSAANQLPGSCKPNSLGDSWTFALYHEGELRLDCWNLWLWANRQKITATRGWRWRNPCLAPPGRISGLLAIATNAPGREEASRNINTKVQWNHSRLKVGIKQFLIFVLLWKQMQGSEAEMITWSKGATLMLSPAAPPWACGSTVQKGNGGSFEQSLSCGQGRTPWPSYAPLNRWKLLPREVNSQKPQWGKLLPFIIRIFCYSFVCCF